MREMEIYVHIPFCVQKCSYCDFLSMPADDDVKKQYIGRLKEEIRQMSEEYPGRPVKSVFFGGGTPSILPGSVITGIMDCIRENFQIQSGAEITIECNPGTLDVSRLTQYKKAGINRLSLGLQSADDKELKLLGRIHTYEDFLKSFDCARKCGFDNINVDVMSGLPTQKLKSWEQTLKKVTGLKPEHISAYGLIVEEGTPFWKIYGYDEETRRKGEQPLFLPSEEEERQMYAFTVEYLGKKGYERYEISNYARPGHQCIHNRGQKRLSGRRTGSFLYDGQLPFFQHRQYGGIFKRPDSGRRKIPAFPQRTDGGIYVPRNAYDRRYFQNGFPESLSGDCRLCIR